MALDGYNYVAAASIHIYTHPSSNVYLIHPKGPWITHLGVNGPPSEPRNNSKCPQHSSIFNSMPQDGQNYVSRRFYDRMSVYPATLLLSRCKCSKVAIKNGKIADQTCKKIRRAIHQGTRDQIIQRSASRTPCQIPRAFIKEFASAECKKRCKVGHGISIRQLNVRSMVRVGWWKNVGGEVDGRQEW